MPSMGVGCEKIALLQNLLQQKHFIMQYLTTGKHDFRSAWHLVSIDQEPYFMDFVRQLVE
jgi:hypothetical protein